MLKLSIRSLTSNKLRFSLTTFAVILGVSFVVASFVLTDGLVKTFDSIVENASGDVDVQVRAEDEFDEVEMGSRPIDEGLADVVAAVDGVDEVAPGTSSMKVVPLQGDGDPIETTGAPILSFNWTDSPLNPLRLSVGRAPAATGEFAIDEGTAERDDLVVGAQYDVVGAAGREPFTLVGLTRFGDENQLAGAVLISFVLDDLQRLDASGDTIQWIDIASAEGVDPAEVIDRVKEVLPAGVEAVPGTVVVDEGQDDFATITDIFGNVLLAFALVAVFVSTFIIGNTFNILLGQRIRQLALLRALGASSAQVRVSALLESLIVGVVASVLGLGGGVLLALGLRALMNSLGFGLPSFDVTLAPRTIIAAGIVGIGVTLVASLSPARRAASVPPIAAMRAGFRFGSGEGKRRTIIAVILTVLGGGALGYGLFGSGSLALVALGLGAVLLFIAVAMYAPLFSSPSASFLGAPLEHVPGGGITGHMARENSARDNKRTASTAAGLMIGLALIAMASVVAESMKESFKSDLGSTMIADYVVTAQGDVGFSNQVVEQVAALPEFAEVSAVRWGNVRVGGSEKEVAGVDVAMLPDLLDVDVQSGDPVAAAKPGYLAVSQDVAEDNGLVVGDSMDVEFAASGVQTLTVGMIYGNDFLIGGYVVDLSTWDENFDSQDDSVISARLADGVDLDTADRALAPIEEQFPQLQFETQAEWTDRLESELDSLLVIINVFLGLAIVIALLGIANTMALSVLERTREIGLMRAIGMTRRQTRTLIRLEAAIVSLFGALLGVVVGLLFGWLAVIAIPDSIISQLAIPGTTLVRYVVIATIAGLLAASFPARRAARLNVLDAITHQ